MIFLKKYYKLLNSKISFNENSLRSLRQRLRPFLPYNKNLNLFLVICLLLSNENKDTIKYDFDEIDDLKEIKPLFEEIVKRYI